MVRSQEWARDVPRFGRSVFINDLGVKSTDVELSDKTKRALIDQGRIATTEYLDKPQQPLPKIKRLLRR
jgi:hypothetical protein